MHGETIKGTIYLMVPLLCYVKAPYHFHDDPYVALTAAYTQHVYAFNPSVTLQLCRHLDGLSN